MRIKIRLRVSNLKPTPYTYASVRPTERSRGTGSNNDRWINNNKKNPLTDGRSNTRFPTSGKEETVTSATNNSSFTRSVSSRSARDFPGNKTIIQEDYDDNKLTFVEYNKSLQEKRNAIEALKTVERKSLLRINLEIPTKEEAARRGRRGGRRGENCVGGRRRYAAIPRTQDGVDFPPLRPAADTIANF
uniref:Uncharacterized protein n=1 Tax=Ananas comosus var. bracteatus TaxID=296719 RepID=A0A6V7NIW6_ANACO|nr:unnamed protein product [Ananas comosus var. bracteatus]